MSLKKILCPTDFSDASISGITYAAKLAKKIGADLTLFNVVALTDLMPEEALMGERVNVRAVRDRLEIQSREVTQIFKISCLGETEATISSISEVIATKAMNYDMVVMGTNGADDLVQFFLGSKTYQAIRKVRKPIIMIPVNTVYFDPSRILYAYPYRRNVQVPITHLVSISKLIECANVTILQIMKDSLRQDAEEELTRFQSSIKKLYGEDVNLTFERIYSPDVVTALDQYMDSNPGDIMALCSEHRSFGASLFQKNVVKSIAGAAHYPVVVFHI